MCRRNRMSPMASTSTFNDTCLGGPGNSSSAAGSTAQRSCACNVGHTGASSGPCLPCVAGTFKAGTGTALCTACPAGSSSAQASTVSTQCICNAGYTERRRVHSLRSRQVFCDCGSSFGHRMSQLRHRPIFDGHGPFYMRRLPWKPEFRRRQHCLDHLPFS